MLEKYLVTIPYIDITVHMAIKYIKMYKIYEFQFV